jgi:SAM-dependent methyltransferase
VAADEVAEFYNRHPYPPPVQDLDAYLSSLQNSIARRAEHHLLWPSRDYFDDHAILVAGCGTSQAAKKAMLNPRATVVGIDVSATSISETQRLADRYQLENLELRRLPIEEVATLGTHFDEIVCTGVLHHLRDPAVGLEALRGVLAEGGALNLMVYAKYGRTGISMIQDYCRMLGVTTSASDIGDLAASLKELPEAHPLSHLLRDTPDFQDNNALADALLHPRDQSYSVPELFELISGSGLRFVRWLRMAPYLPGYGSIASTPHGVRIAALDMSDQYAAMELFRGTMTRHSAILHHAAENAGAGLPRFDGDSWRSYIPVRVPTAVLIEDRLPAGADAALLNRAHSYSDLVMFLDAEQKRQFELIDGTRRAGSIAKNPDFLQRLWQHDLVVFDTSQGAAK